jgi:hypothetical protein
MTCGKLSITALGIDHTVDRLPALQSLDFAYDLRNAFFTQGAR